jgi:predicted SAM-dependent methyltransferase
MLTIDLFTTPKPFTGLTAIHQANALRSWRGCAQVRQIFVFGAVSGETSAIAETGAEVIPDVECTDNGLPSIRSMFEIAAERSGADLLMFTNADMIYLPSFFAGVDACRAEAGGRFLLVGSRMDFESESALSFDSPAAIAEVEAHLHSVGKMHPPSGSDYFIFPRRQYLENRLPDLWIGRGGWDLYMIYHAKTNGFRTVDLSPSVWGYHQNHDYSNRGKDAGVSYDKDPEASYNISLLPDGSWRQWTLRGCPTEWANGSFREKTPEAEDGAKSTAGTPGKNPERKKKLPKSRNAVAKRFRWEVLMSRIRGAFGGPKKVSGVSAPGSVSDPKRIVQDSILETSRAGKPVMLVVGAGRTGYEGWISTNIDSLNLLDRADWESLVGKVRLDRVLAEHVWEHLSPNDGITALKNVADHLKPGGRVRIAVPDGHHPDADYIRHVKPGGTGPGANDHKILYTSEILEAAMREAGLVPEVLEHWDAGGEFHAKEWDSADGKVVRSLKYDSRNASGALKYTSLIVDGVKPSR